MAEPGERRGRWLPVLAGLMTEPSTEMARYRQHWASRLLVNVTAAHRGVAVRQFLVQQIAYWVTVLGLFVADLTEGGDHAGTPGLTSSTWLLVSLVTWLIRLALFVPIYVAPLEEVARSAWLKWLPMLIVAVAGGYWIWTLSLLVADTVSLRELFLCIGFLTISIAMTALWPVTPVAVIVYNLVLWGALSTSLYVRNVAGLPALAFFNSCVLLILWIYVFMSVQAHSKNEALAELQQKTQRTLAARSAFFAGASHDLKQRLHGTKLIIISAKSALREHPDLADTFTCLGKEIDALQGFMGAILDNEKLEALAMNVQLRTVALQSIFQDLDVQFEQTAQSRNVVLRFRFTPLKIGTDAAMLHRILMNLVSNALKFTRPGGEVLVSARRAQGGALIQVWDQGPGIKPDAYERVFEAFHQENATEAAPSSESGYGLGLSVVKQFSDSLGYKVSIASRIGKGTRFTVSVPTGFLLD